MRETTTLRRLEAAAGLGAVGSMRRMGRRTAELGRLEAAAGLGAVVPVP
jgi:hypothetical protein